MRKLTLVVALVTLAAAAKNGVQTGQRNGTQTGAQNGAPSARLTAREAKYHVGETATVCGKIVGIHYVSSGKGQPTFVHFDEQYPNQIFTMVIWGSDRPKFGRPEEIYRDKDVCVSGRITIYLGIPEIVVSNPKQVQIQK